MQYIASHIFKDTFICIILYIYKLTLCYIYCKYRVQEITPLYIIIIFLPEDMVSISVAVFYRSHITHFINLKK